MALLGFGPMVDYNASRFLSTSAGDFEEFGGGGDIRRLEGHLVQAATNIGYIFEVSLELK